MTTHILPTKERLARAITERSQGNYDPRVELMIGLARKGHYDEFETDLEMPIVTLVYALRQVGFDDLAQRAMDGEFDSTREEGEAWMQRQGWKLLTDDEPIA